MNRILIISALLLAVVFTATADRRRLMLARNVAAGGGGGGISSPTNLTQRMWWYSGDAAYAQLGAEGQNVVTTLDSIIDGPTLTEQSSRAAGLSNNWVNGKSALLFIAAQDQLTNYATAYNWAQPFYVFVVERTLQASTLQYMMAATNAAIGYSSANNFRAGAGTEFGVTTVDRASWKIVVTYFNGANSWIRTNGVAGANGNLNTGVWNGVSIGGLVGGTSRWGGELAETFACQDALTTNELIFLERQLGTNYGITTP